MRICSVRLCARACDYACFVSACKSVSFHSFFIVEFIHVSSYFLISLFVLQWTAPEALAKRLHTKAADVWSFGITLFEIMTFGTVPYAWWNEEQTYACFLLVLVLVLV